MPVRFNWKPNDLSNSSVMPTPPIQLDLFGVDEPQIAQTAAGTPGRVVIFEVGGQSRGPQETAQQRVIATFHGNFHLDTRRPAPQRITFELFGTRVRGAPPVPSADVLGFDPECIVGVDGMILWFVSREFPIFFPFFIDTQTEANFIEIIAIAEIGPAGTAIDVTAAQNPVLNIRVRKGVHQIQTSTRERYAGKLIGNIVTHHENYLLPTAPTTPSFLPVVAQGTRQPDPKIEPRVVEATFQPYAAGDLTILIMANLIDSMVPSAGFLRGEFPFRPDLPPIVRQRLIDQVRAQITDVFLDSGFIGTRVLFQGEGAATPLVTQFNTAFRFNRGNFELVNPTRPLILPFWSFIIATGTAPQGSTVLAHAQSDGLFPFQLDRQHTVLLTGPLPIGSGTKQTLGPVVFFTAQMPGIARGIPNIGALNERIDQLARSVAIVICHEVAHSLGLMHDVPARASVPLIELALRGALTIMAEDSDSNTRIAPMRFSNQAKVIWQNAFGVAPELRLNLLTNRTWGPGSRLGGTFATVDWPERRKRFFEQGGLTGVVPPDLGTIGIRPFQESVQRGTFQ